MQGEQYTQRKKKFYMVNSYGGNEKTEPLDQVVFGRTADWVNVIV